MEEKIVIGTSPNYWQKTKFRVGIMETDSTEISGEEYTKLAKEAIEIWNKKLDEYSKKTKNEHLGKIRFEVSKNPKGDEDVLIQWRYSNPGHGRTYFEQEEGKIIRSSIFVAKYHGPNIPVLKSKDEISHSKLTFHSREQIRSIVLHEIGHVLGLGHCNYSKDLMHASTTAIIDTERKFSSLDFDVIGQLFRGYFEENKVIMITHMIPKSRWKPI